MKKVLLIAQFPASHTHSGSDFIIFIIVLSAATLTALLEDMDADKDTNSNDQTAAKQC